MNTHVVRFSIDLSLPDAEDRIADIKMMGLLLGGTVSEFRLINAASVLVRIDQIGCEWFAKNRSPAYAGLA